MVTRIGGARRKTRGKFKKSLRQKGKISIRRYLQEFKVGDKVNLLADSGVQKGIYCARFHGKCGVVSGKKGECFEVKIDDGKLQKTLIIHPVHLKK